MAEKDLLVRIPEKLKEEILSRFDEKNSAGQSEPIIGVSCCLCVIHQGICDGCPFSSWSTSCSGGCINFLNKFLSVGWDKILCLRFNKVSWFKENDQEARALLNKIREILNDPTKIRWV
ncbi:MAG: hypothetical protein NTV62_03010 [Candidatus Gribaldobacteria bacterium]|nr:hypothetical protein [Candidatus Gribaldobacteria bacterium]